MSTDSSNEITPTGFSQLGLSASMCETLSELGYEQPSAIQSRVIKPFLEGRDILGLAQTGTGKTAAFALPLIAQIENQLKKPQALILAPTRELAIQVSEAFQSYAKRIKNFHVLPIYGGQDMGAQLRQLRRGVHVVVGTPGRVMDHMRRNSLDLSELQTLVLDEADEMLRMGFIDDVEWILRQTPEKRQLALFCATMPEAISRIAGQYLDNPVEIRIKSRTKTVECTAQTYIVVENNRKMDALTRILEADSLDAAIVFVRTKNATTELAQKLEARGFSSAAINSDLNQKQRENTIADLKKGNIDILVATDVAARGIDVSRVSLVVNYDIPHDAEAYVHRIGRTGRAGREGKALLLITPREKRLLKMIEHSTRQPIEYRPLPTNEEIGAQRASQFREKIMTVIDNEPLDDLRTLIQGISTETGASMEDLAAGLAWLAQKSKSLRVVRHKGPDDAGSSRDRDNWHREAKPRKSGSESGAARADAGMEIYQLQVGLAHGVAVKDILGAVANELDIDADYIGKIRLDDQYSYMQLPGGMPKELQAEFRKLRICGQQCHASVTKEAVDMGKRNGPSRKKIGKGSKPTAADGRGSVGGRPAENSRRKTNRKGRSVRSQNRD